jgi:hypothetical protein
MALLITFSFSGRRKNICNPILTTNYSYIPDNLLCNSNNIILERGLGTEGLSFLGGHHKKQFYNSVDFYDYL